MLFLKGLILGLHNIMVKYGVWIQIPFQFQIWTSSPRCMTFSTLVNLTVLQFITIYRAYKWGTEPAVRCEILRTVTGTLYISCVIKVAEGSAQHGICMFVVAKWKRLRVAILGVLCGNI